VYSNLEFPSRVMDNFWLKARDDCL